MKLRRTCICSHGQSQWLYCKDCDGPEVAWLRVILYDLDLTIEINANEIYELKDKLAKANAIIRQLQEEIQELETADHDPHVGVQTEDDPS